MHFNPFPHSPSEDRNSFVAQIFPWKCEFFRGFSAHSLSGQATAHKKFRCLQGTSSQVLSNTFFPDVSLEDLMAGEGGEASLCFKHILCRRDLSPPIRSTGISSNVRHTWWPAASGHMCPKMTEKLWTVMLASVSGLAGATWGQLGQRRWWGCPQPAANGAPQYPKRETPL